MSLEKLSKEAVELVAELANLISKHGEDSKEVADFIEIHKEEKEFSELAPLMQAVKKIVGLPRKRDPSATAATEAEFPPPKTRVLNLKNLAHLFKSDEDRAEFVNALREAMSQADTVLAFDGYEPQFFIVSNRVLRKAAHDAIAEALQLKEKDK